jgi:hypothetical protein
MLVKKEADDPVKQFEWACGLNPKKALFMFGRHRNIDDADRAERQLELMSGIERIGPI